MLQHLWIRLCGKRSRLAPPSRKTRKSRKLTVERLEDRLAPARFDFLGIAADPSDWHDPNNWSQASLPGPQDDVYLSNAAIAIVNLTQPAAIQSLHLDAPDLTLNLQANLETVDGVFSAGKIEGNGEFRITGTFDWFAGTLGGGVQTHVQPLATLNLLDPDVPPPETQPPLVRALEGTHLLRNEGIINWTGWSDLVVASGSPIFENLSNFYIRGANKITGLPEPMGSNLTLVNNGLIQIISDPQNPDIVPAVVFENILIQNSGSMVVQEGNLTINNVLTNNGSLTVAAEAQLELAGGNNTFANGSTTSGEGEIIFSGGVSRFYGSYDLGTTTILGGTVGLAFDANTEAFSKKTLMAGGGLSGQGDFATREQFVWSGGWMDGGGKTKILPCATLEIVTGLWKTLGTRSLIIEANAEAIWTGDDDVGIDPSGVLRNDGDFIIQTNQKIVGTGGDFTNEVINNGVLRKVAPTADSASVDYGTGASSFENIHFVNGETGQMIIEAGQLLLSGSATLQGSVALGRYAALELGPGNFTIPSPLTISGINLSPPGKVVVKGGTLTLNNSLTVPNLELLYHPTFLSQIDGFGTLTITKKLAWDSGVFNGTGDLIIEATGYLHMGTGIHYLGQRSFHNYGRTGGVGYYNVFASHSPGSFDSYYTSVEPNLAYMNGQDAAWQTFMGRMDTAWSTFIADESNANNNYDASVLSLDSPFELGKAQVQSDYEQALAQADFLLQEGLLPEEEYWDQVADAEQVYDEALQALTNNYIATESTYYSQWRTALQDARDRYRQEVTSALDQLTSAVEGAARPGHGNITLLTQSLENLLNAGPDSWPTVISFLTSLPTEARAALDVEYYKRNNEALVTPLSIISQGIGMDAFYQGLDAFYHGGVDYDYANLLAAGQAITTITSNNQNRVNGWGTTVAGNFQTMANYDPATGSSWWDTIAGNVSSFFDGVAGGARAAWRETTGFVRDVTYLARNDPAALGTAIREGVRDGATITANAFTFDQIPDLSAEAQRLVQENGGLYRLSAFSASMSRDLLLTAATLGGTSIATRAGAEWLAARLVAHPNLACALTMTSRAYQPIQAVRSAYGMYQGGRRAVDAINRGDYEAAGRAFIDMGLNAMTAYGSARESLRMGRALVSGDTQKIRDYFFACFAAGTPILGEFGAKNVEDYRPGDRVRARNEHDPNGPVELKEVEEIFRSHAEIWHLHVGGQVIRTTAEHPFYVLGRGWVNAQDMHIGDLMLSHDGQTRPVEDILSTGQAEEVYNFRVADHHTYFVAGNHWAFSVWAHNRCNNPWGRRGSPAHRARIEQAQERFERQGWARVSGGTGRENRVVIPGTGRYRYPDLVMERTLPNGTVEQISIQVGRVDANNNPVARELSALADLRFTGLYRHVFFLKY